MLQNATELFILHQKYKNSGAVLWMNEYILKMLETYVNVLNKEV